jgi:outer membrane protein insertion porin family
MWLWLARPVLLGIACLFTLQEAYPQNTDLGAMSEEQAHAYRLCPPSLSESQQSPGPQISVAEVSFLGTLRMPVSAQQQIAASLKELTGPVSLDGVVDDALERVRAAWQDRGYFKVQVSGNATTLTNRPVNQRIALNVHVDEGQQYRLGSIRFKNNKAIRDAGALRALFPIADGDVLSREKIADGLENLRKAYGEIGYINFVPVPDTRFNDEKSLIYLEIEMDEGKQFRLSSISFPGLDEVARQEILRDPVLQPGQVYNQGVFGQSLQKHGSLLDSCSSERQMNERAGTVAIRLDFGQCPLD